MRSTARGEGRAGSPSIRLDEAAVAVAGATGEKDIEGAQIGTILQIIRIVIINHDLG